MSKCKVELLGAVVLVMVTAGTALAQNPDYPTAPDDPAAQQPTQQPTQQPAQAPMQQPGSTVVVVPPPAPVTYESESSGMRRMERVGFSLSMGGGVTDFTNREMRDTTGVGGSWAVRAVLGTKTPLGFEGSYIGSAQSIDTLGIARDSVLVGNGLQGALRLNAAIGAPITPFVFGGVAWNHYELTNTSSNTSAFESDDDVLELPVGIGIGGSWRGFGYDLRGELRFANNEDMVPELSAGRDTGRSADMHRWGVNATLGYGF
jgi:hypothetical protein